MERTKNSTVFKLVATALMAALCEFHIFKDTDSYNIR